MSGSTNDIPERRLAGTPTLLGSERWSIEGSSRGLRSWRMLFVSMVVAVSVAGGAGCMEAVLCETEVTQEVASPSGRLTAVEYHRDCGATTPVNTQLAIVLSEDKGSPEAGQVLALTGRHDLHPEWRGEGVLSVRLPREKVFRKEGKWNEVRIEYRE